MIETAADQPEVAAATAEAGTIAAPAPVATETARAEEQPAAEPPALKLAPDAADLDMDLDLDDELDQDIDTEMQDTVGSKRRGIRLKQDLN